MFEDTRKISADGIAQCQSAYLLSDGNSSISADAQPKPLCRLGDGTEASLTLGTQRVRSPVLCSKQNILDLRYSENSEESYIEYNEEEK